VKVLVVVVCVCARAWGMLGEFLGMVVGIGLDGEIRSSNRGKARLLSPSRDRGGGSL
jgi:hypothetical protein